MLGLFYVALGLIGACLIAVAVLAFITAPGAVGRDPGRLE